MQRGLFIWLLIMCLVSVTALPAVAGASPVQMECADLSGSGDVDGGTDELDYYIEAKEGDVLFIEGTGALGVTLNALTWRIYDPVTNDVLFLIQDNTFVGKFSFKIVVPEDGTYGYYLAITSDQILTYEFGCEPAPDDGTDADEIILCQNVFDGRVNNNTALDCAAPIAVFLGESSLDIYGVDPLSGSGASALRIQASLLDSPSPSANEQLASGVNPYTGQPIVVYRLASGELQINSAYADGKPYQIVFMAGVDGSLHHLAA